MSRHFTYEIDESSLSFKLKNLQSPINEEAWQKFDKMTDDYFGKETVSTGLQFIKEFRIPLNRKTLMPLAFGISIIMFAILLFNFVSIKVSPKKFAQEEQVKMTQTVLKQETKQKPVELVLSTQVEVQQAFENKQANRAQPVKQTAIAEIPEQMPIAKSPVAVQEPQTIDLKTGEQVAEQIRPTVINEDDENSTLPITP